MKQIKSLCVYLVGASVAGITHCFGIKEPALFWLLGAFTVILERMIDF